MKKTALKISDDKNNIVFCDVIELKSVVCSGCYGCFFEEYKHDRESMCDDVPCCAGERQDGNNVIFMRSDELAEAVLK